MLCIHYGASKIMKGAKMQRFDKEYDQFLFERDVELHRKAVRGLLSLVGLAKMYNYTIEDKNALPDFFLTWKIAAKEEEDQNERKGLESIGKLSEEYFKKKDYRALSKLFADIVLRHLVEFIHLKEREDFEEITDNDLYEKGLIPGEIYLQFFLIETMSKAKDFDWSRNEDVVNQNLACLIVCFSDIYDFLNNSDESKIEE